MKTICRATFAVGLAIATPALAEEIVMARPVTRILPPDPSAQPAAQAAVPATVPVGSVLFRSLTGPVTITTAPGSISILTVPLPPGKWSISTTANVEPDTDGNPNVALCSVLIGTTTIASKYGTVGSVGPAGGMHTLYATPDIDVKYVNTTRKTLSLYCGMIYPLTVGAGAKNFPKVIKATLKATSVPGFY